MSSEESQLPRPSQAGRSDEEPELTAMPFVGRNAELSKLRSALALLTRQRRGGIVWTRGASGMGKSRFLDQGINEARRFGIATLAVHSERRPGGPFPLIESIDAFLSRLPDDAFQGYVDSGLPDLLAVFIRREPRLAEREWARSVRPALDLAPDADRLRFHHTLMRFFTLLSSAGGCVLAFDDLDQADAESREIVRFVARNARREALLIMASSLSGGAPPQAESKRREHLRRLALELFGIIPTLVLELEPLTVADVGEMLPLLLDPPRRGQAGGQFLDDVARQSLAQAIWRASQGSPLLARVLVPLTRSLGIVIPAERGLQLARPSDLADLPRTAREVASCLAQIMPPRRVGILEALAAYTAPCEQNHLVEISGILPHEVSDEVDESVRMGVLGTHQAASGSRYLVFSLKEMRELLLEQMDAKQRHFMHRRIAELLESQPGSPLSLIAFHRLESGDVLKGFDAALHGGMEAKALYKNSEALELLGRCVALAATTPGLVEDHRAAMAHEALADVLTLIGRWPEALEQYREATVRALKTDDRARAARTHRKSGEILEEMGQIDDARLSYERGLQLLDPNGMGSTEDAVEAGDLHASLGWLVGHLRGEHARGIALMEKCLEIGRRLSDARLQARALNGIGVILNGKGDWAVAVEAYERALYLNESSGNKSGASSNYNNLAVIFAHRGDLSQAFRYYRKSLKLDREVGNLRGVAVAYNNLGTLCFKMGQWERSLGYYSHCRAMAVQLGDMGLIGLAETNVGDIRLRRGEFHLAEKHLQRSVKIHRELGQSEGLATVLGSLGVLHTRVGRFAEAEECLRAAEKLSLERDAKENLAEVVLDLAELHLAKGDLASAEEHSVRASRLVHRLSLDVLMGDVYGVFGSVKAAMGEPEEALSFFTKALEVFRSMRQPYKLAMALYRYGAHLNAMGEDGVPFLEKAHEIWDRLGARHDAALALAALGSQQRAPDAS